MEMKSWEAQFILTVTMKSQITKPAKQYNNSNNYYALCALHFPT